MNFRFCSEQIRRLRTLAYVMSATMVLLCASGHTSAQILVSNFIGDSSNPIGVIGEYNLDGTAINPALIPANGDRIAVSDSNVFVLRNVVGFAGSVGEYTTSGATIDSEFITGIYGLRSLASSAGSLFVSDSSNVGNVLKFDLEPPFSSGLLISDFQLANGLAVSRDGRRLYVVDSFAGMIGEYDASTGTQLTQRSLLDLIIQQSSRCRVRNCSSSHWAIFSWERLARTLWTARR